MSYNNIGLTTPRGSGTSGYVQRNLSHVQPRDDYRTNSAQSSGGGRYDDGPAQHRKPDAAILEHERKRRIENKCVELQLELEEQDVDEHEIETRVDELRQKLMKEDMGRDRGPLKPHETHEIAAMKARENEKFRTAMGVNASYIEGQAFDKDLQATRKLQAIEERQKRDADRAARTAKLQEERASWEKRRQEQMSSRSEVQKEISARREEAERRRTRQQEDRRGDTRRNGPEDGKSASLMDRIQPATGDRPTSRHAARDGRISPVDEPRDGRAQRHRGRSRSMSPVRSSRLKSHGEPRRPGDSYRPTARRRSMSASPRRSDSDSRSRSPPPRARSRSDSSSRSSSSRVRSRARRHSRSRSPPRRRFSRSPTASPRRRDDKSLSRSPSPVRRDRSPHQPRRARSKSLVRAGSLDSDCSRRPKRSRVSENDSPPPPPGFRPYRKADQADDRRRSSGHASRQSARSPTRSISRSRSPLSERSRSSVSQRSRSSVSRKSRSRSVTGDGDDASMDMSDASSN